MDALQLTPGTVFMEQAPYPDPLSPLSSSSMGKLIGLVGWHDDMMVQVREALCHYACSRLLDSSAFRDLRFVVSPSTAPGKRLQLDEEDVFLVLTAGDQARPS